MMHFRTTFISLIMLCLFASSSVHSAQSNVHSVQSNTTFGLTSRQWAFVGAAGATATAAVVGFHYLTNRRIQKRLADGDRKKRGDYSSSSLRDSLRADVNNNLRASAQDAQSKVSEEEHNAAERLAKQAQLAPPPAYVAQAKVLEENQGAPQRAELPRGPRDNGRKALAAYLAKYDAQQKERKQSDNDTVNKDVHDALERQRVKKQEKIDEATFTAYVERHKKELSTIEDSRQLTDLSIIRENSRHYSYTLNLRAQLLAVMARLGDYDGVREILDGGVTADGRLSATSRGIAASCLPLTAAVRGGHMGVVQLLIDRKANPCGFDHENADNWAWQRLERPAFAAVALQDFCIAALLFTNGAAHKGHEVALAKKVFLTNLDDIEKKGRISFLFSHQGCDLSDKSYAYHTSLGIMAAMLKDRQSALDWVKFLLDSGLSGDGILIAVATGLTSRDASTREQGGDVVRLRGLLQAKRSDQTKLFDVNQGWDGREGDHITPLMVLSHSYQTCDSDDAAFIELLRHNADPDVGVQHELKAIDSEVYRGRQHRIDLLLLAGASSASGKGRDCNETPPKVDFEMPLVYVCQRYNKYKQRESALSEDPEVWLRDRATHSPSLENALRHFCATGEPDMLHAQLEKQQSNELNAKEISAKIRQRLPEAKWLAKQKRHSDLEGLIDQALAQAQLTQEGAIDRTMLDYQKALKALDELAMLPLARAAAQPDGPENAQKLLDLLTQGASPDEGAPLAVAAHFGNREAIKMLWLAGATNLRTDVRLPKCWDCFPLDITEPPFRPDNIYKNTSSAQQQQIEEILLARTSTGKLSPALYLFCVTDHCGPLVRWLENRAPNTAFKEETSSFFKKRFQYMREDMLRNNTGENLRIARMIDHVLAAASFVDSASRI